MKKIFIGLLVIITLAFCGALLLKSSGSVKKEALPSATISLTIPEGATLKQVARLAANQGILSQASLLAAAAAPNVAALSSEFAFLKELKPQASLEGYLFPDTYKFERNMKAVDFIKPILKNFQIKVAPGLAAEIGQSQQSLREIIIMASLAEKEAQSPEDRSLVAGVINNRLRLGLPLELDSTVTYFSGNNSGVFDKGEKLSGSPYNTFRNLGLPPGPIANPGLSSIEAALRPMPSNYLYFLTDAQGHLHFAATLEEHYINRAKFLE